MRYKWFIYTRGENRSKQGWPQLLHSNCQHKKSSPGKTYKFLKIESDVKILYLEKMSTDNIRKQMVLTSKNSGKIFVSIFIEV